MAADSGSVLKRKFCVLGAGVVGKTSSVVQFAESRFIEFHQSSTLTKFTKRVKWLSREYDVELFDTEGLDGQGIFLGQTIMNMDGFVLIYSIDDRGSFDIIRSLNAEIVSSAGNDVPRILVGNKTDLENSREIGYSEGKKLADEIGAKTFYEASAKENRNVNHVFMHLLATVEGEKYNPDDGDEKGGGCRIM